MSKKEFLEKVERHKKPYQPELWGKVYDEYSPEVLSTVFGDGEQLMCITNINNRPYGWLVFIDSETVIDYDYDWQNHEDEHLYELGLETSL